MDVANFSEWKPVAGSKTVVGVSCGTHRWQKWVGEGADWIQEREKIPPRKDVMIVASALCRGNQQHIGDEKL